MCEVFSSYRAVICVDCAVLSVQCAVCNVLVELAKFRLMCAMRSVQCLVSVCSTQ